MNRTSLYLVVILGAAAALPKAGVAAQKKHHPWLSRHHELPLPSRERAGEAGVRERVPSSALRSPSPEKGEGKKIVTQALRYKGTKYKFGGTTKKGLDCSGLVARVWSDLKMKRVPRVSSALYHTGEPVRLSELRPGDLVFFKNTYKHGISHVGVYTGNNKFVHAANHRLGVTVASLSDPYYQLHYAGARRLY